MTITAEAYKKMFPGMKKVPLGYVIATKNRKTTIKVKSATRIQKLKKVRKGESLQAWERRVRAYNIVTEEEIARKLNAKKYVYKAEIRDKDYQRRCRNQKNKVVKVYFNDKQYDFLKYYSIVINFYARKHAIKITDLEIAFAFYNNKIINIDRFNNMCIMSYGNPSATWKRFKKEGYIIEVTNKLQFEKREDKEVKTGVYKLSLSMTKIITCIYEVLAKLNTIKKRQYEGMYSKEVEVELIKMNEDIQDYLSMIKPQDIIKNRVQ